MSYFRYGIVRRLLHADDLVVGYTDATKNSDVVAAAVYQFNPALKQVRFFGFDLVSRNDYVIGESPIVKIGCAPGAAGLAAGKRDNRIALFEWLIDDDNRSAVSKERPITEIRDRNDKQDKIQQIDSLPVFALGCGRFHAVPQPPPPGVWIDRTSPSSTHLVNFEGSCSALPLFWVMRFIPGAPASAPSEGRRGSVGCGCRR